MAAEETPQKKAKSLFIASEEGVGTQEAWQRYRSSKWGIRRELR